MLLASTTTTSTSTTTVTTTTAIRTTTAVTTTTTVQTSFSCYDCSDAGQQTCTAKTSNCPMCMVYRNDQDPSESNLTRFTASDPYLRLLSLAKFDRRCCWWACGAPNQISNHGGRPTYFCNADNCNAPGSEYALGYISKKTWATSDIFTKSLSSDYQYCSGDNDDDHGSTNVISMLWLFWTWLWQRRFRTIDELSHVHGLSEPRGSK